jgi:hypothetical protein
VPPSCTLASFNSSTITSTMHQSPALLCCLVESWVLWQAVLRILRW